MKNWIILLIVLLILSLSGNAFQGISYSSQVQQMNTYLTKQIGDNNILGKALTEKNLEIIDLNNKISSIIDWYNLKYFADLEELKLFLISDNTSEYVFIDDVFVCSDFSSMLIENAAKKGYIMEGEIIYQEGRGWHEKCWTKIIDQNVVVFIEPQSDDITIGPPFR